MGRKQRAQPSWHHVSFRRKAASENTVGLVSLQIAVRRGVLQFNATAARTKHPRSVK